ncbi:hypothetical protein [Pseudomonas putida]|uniref:hypothetical protein n=1 Tax=Pseudomonas putida TaxID=303 RepID=UPI003D963BC0
MDESLFRICDVVLKSFTIVGVVVAALWAYHTYTDTKEKEFYSAFWNTKLSLFLETSAAASTMATTESIEDFNTARKKYRELFFGRLSLVEGQSTKRAMELFFSKVPDGAVGQGELPFSSMEQPAYQLTLALKQELGIAWKTPFGEL